MPALLHNPRNTLVALTRIQDAYEAESDSLEFKSGNEKDFPSVFANAVAALATADGGDLILGAATERDKSTNRDRWSAWVREEEPFNEKNLREDLARLLAQRELADTVEFNPFEINTAKGRRFVIVATVPPWPHGAVATVSQVDPQQASYKFPIRSGAQTRFMRFEEAMQRSDVQLRSMYLRLKGHEKMLAPAFKPVAIRSPVLVKTPAVTFQYTPELNTPYQAMDPDVLVDHVRLTMMPVFTTPMSTVRFGRLPVVIPLDLIEAAWIEDQPPNSQAKLACLMLSATLECDGKRWTLTRRSAE